MHKIIPAVLGIASAFFLLSALSLVEAEQHGEARVLVQERCTACHNLNRVKRKIGNYDSRAWDEYVVRMQKKGARVNDSERDIIVEFLSALESGKDL